jgi:hypothetical protein
MTGCSQYIEGNMEVSPPPSNRGRQHSINASASQIQALQLVGRTVVVIIAVLKELRDGAVSAEELSQFDEALVLARTAGQLVWGRLDGQNPSMPVDLNSDDQALGQVEPSQVGRPMEVEEPAIVDGPAQVVEPPGSEEICRCFTFNNCSTHDTPLCHICLNVCGCGKCRFNLKSYYGYFGLFENDKPEPLVQTQPIVAQSRMIRPNKCNRTKSSNQSLSEKSVNSLLGGINTPQNLYAAPHNVDLDLSDVNSNDTFVGQLIDLNLEQDLLQNDIPELYIEDLGFATTQKK